MSQPVYPLTAIVAADALKLALCLTAIDPRIGGVLIAGPRGMAKSTLARAMVDILPQGQFVTLPLGATEERITGTLDLNAALGDGEVKFSPGLLARADNGILYVDEVNLLSDHLVDLLLDVAASGVNVVERDCVSHQHAARFILIGTMNPDEGELRPQLLDRFGFYVHLAGSPEPHQRAEITRRRLAFDADPLGFRAQWSDAQGLLVQQCLQARERLDSIPLDDTSVTEISQRCFAAGVDGMRADLVWLRAARAHAAWRGADHIARSDIDAVEDFALLHRLPAKKRAQSPSSSSREHEERESANGNAQHEVPKAPALLNRPDTSAVKNNSAETTSQNRQNDDADWGGMPPQATRTGSARQIRDWVRPKGQPPKKW